MTTMIAPLYPALLATYCSTSASLQCPVHAGIELVLANEAGALDVLVDDDGDGDVEGELGVPVEGAELGDKIEPVPGLYFRTLTAPPRPHLAPTCHFTGTVA